MRHLAAMHDVSFRSTAFELRDSAAGKPRWAKSRAQALRSAAFRPSPRKLTSPGSTPCTCVPGRSAAPEERAHDPSKWENEATRVIFNEEGAGRGTALPPHWRAA